MGVFNAGQFTEQKKLNKQTKEQGDTLTLILEELQKQTALLERLASR